MRAAFPNSACKKTNSNPFRACINTNNACSFTSISVQTPRIQRLFDAKRLNVIVMKQQWTSCAVFCIDARTLATQNDKQGFYSQSNRLNNTARHSNDQRLRTTKQVMCAAFSNSACKKTNSDTFRACINTNNACSFTSISVQTPRIQRLFDAKRLNVIVIKQQ